MRKSGSRQWRRYFLVNKFAFGALLCGMSAATVAQTFSSPGPALNMLQQIQGGWRSSCHPQPAALGSGFQQIRLTVQFTHFTFLTEEFDEPDCRIKRAGNKSRYRFALREPFVTESQEKVFAIDFQPEEISPGVSPIYPLNIVSYKSGKLYLGEPSASDVQERLQKLDRAVFFSRR
jgi:hypothetical protein